VSGLVPLARRHLVGGSRVGFLWGSARLEVHDGSGAKQTARAGSLKPAIYDGDLAVRALQMVHGLAPLWPASVSRPAPAVLELALAMALVDGRTTEKGPTRYSPGLPSLLVRGLPDLEVPALKRGQDAGSGFLRVRGCEAGNQATVFCFDVLNPVQRQQASRSGWLPATGTR
jgi:hypothetical protein